MGWRKRADGTVSVLKTALAGRALEMADEVFDGALAKLALACRAQLTQDEWTELILEFRRGRSHISYIITVKLQHWQSLPWLLCGIAHVDVDTARSCASRALAAYDESIEASLHRMAHKFCAPGSDFRRSLELFAAGSDSSTLPEDFQVEMSKLFWIPCTERCVERPHGVIKKYVTYKKHSPLSVSMSIRKGEVERDFSTGDSFSQLCEHARATRHVRRLPSLLGFADHAWIRALDHSHQTNHWVSIVAKIIYRCDDS